MAFFFFSKGTIAVNRSCFQASDDCSMCFDVDISGCYRAMAIKSFQNAMKSHHPSVHLNGAWAEKPRGLGGGGAMPHGAVPKVRHA